MFAYFKKYFLSISATKLLVHYASYRRSHCSQEHFFYKSVYSMLWLLPHRCSPGDARSVTRHNDPCQHYRPVWWSWRILMVVSRRFAFLPTSNPYRQKPKLFLQIEIVRTMILFGPAICYKTIKLCTLELKKYGLYSMGNIATFRYSWCKKMHFGSFFKASACIISIHIY